MKSIGIFYGSETGTTAGVARRIAARMGVEDKDVHDVAGLSPTVMADYDVILAGSSTWGSGEIEHDWYDFTAGASMLDLQGKKMAFFGCGDESMSDTFCDAVGELYDAFAGTGAEYIGRFDAGAYEFTSSKAVRDGEMVGLVLDEVNHADLSDERIARWTDKVKAEL